MKIVKFNNGKYAVRRFSILALGYEYKNLMIGGHSSFWWSRRSEYFKDCLGDLDVAKKVYNELTDKGTPLA